MIRIFLKGIWEENPVMILLLGMCPTLAVTNMAINGLAMGASVAFVLISSSLMVSIFRKMIMPQVRMAAYIVIIATFVTVADMILKAYFYDVSKALGPYIPLIVVNCIILGRAEAFSSKNTVLRSLMDALGMSVGFTSALVLLSIIREILGMGSVFGVPVLGGWFEPWIIMILPPGAFLALGFLIGMNNLIKLRLSSRQSL